MSNENFFATCKVKRWRKLKIVAVSLSSSLRALPAHKRIYQEYPTEPLDKIPALQGRIALAGKLNIGHTHLLENLYEHLAGWEFMLQRWF